MASRHPPIAEWPEWPLIRTERELLGKLTDAFRTRPEAHLSTVFPLLDSAGGSTETLIELCGRVNIRDGYVLARVVYETLVNACFIVAGGAPLADRAWRHARQKTLRDLDRTIELAGKKVMQVQWSGAGTVLGDPDNQKRLAEFTSRSGREITAWTPENVSQRLEVVHARFGEEPARGMLFGLLLYRHASEIAHGTLYGSLFILGGTDPKGPPKSIDELAEFRIDHTRMLLMLTGFALESAIWMVGSEIGATELADEARKAQRVFSERRRPDA